MLKTPMISIAILMTVFNRKEATVRCLNSLRSQHLPDGCGLTIYLLNDGCTDGTPDVVRNSFPEVNVIDGDGTLFWNRGMYTAWDVAAKEKDYDAYLWLNDDCIVYPDMVKALVAASDEKDGKAIIVGGTQSLDHQRQTYGGRMRDNSFPTMGNGLVKVDYFNGNIVFVPRSVYKTLGNLDSYYTHRFGDFDYGHRARLSNIEIFQVGEFLGECDTHTELDKWCNPNVPLRQRWNAFGRPNGMPPKEVFYFEKKYYGTTKAVIHYFTTILHCICPSLWKR